MKRALTRLDEWYGWLVGSKEGLVALFYIAVAVLLGWPLFALFTGRLH